MENMFSEAVVYITLLGLIYGVQSNCTLTSSDLYGPYYIPNAPRLQTICQYKTKNESVRVPLHVFGRVFAADCKTPLPRVKIEVWQADHEGEYRNSTNCRGILETNKNGFYEFRTIFPGKYKVSEFDKEFRPAHIHYKINGKKGHKTLVTQMYFSGDTNLGKNDPCMSCSSGSRELVTNPRKKCKGERKGRHCIDTTKFNIVLTKGNGLDVSPVLNDLDNTIC